jgi:large subunit ribosomal protein L25
VADNALVAELRDGQGKGVARKLRQTGRIPAVVYGRKRAAQSITVSPDALAKVLHGASGMNTLIDLAIGGATETVLVKALQRDPVRGRYLHADFYQVDLTQKVTVSVPIHLVGKAIGTDFGGILDHPLRELSIECLPREIPQFIEVDVSQLAVNDSIHVSDLSLAPGLTVKTDGKLAVASVVLPAAEEEAAPAAVAAEGAEGAAAEGAAAAATTAEPAAKAEEKGGAKGGEKKK